MTVMYARLPGRFGFTLIEMLTTLALTGVLLAGLLVLFTNLTESYRLDFAIAQIQDNGRFSYQLIEWDLRNAGYQGCIDTKKTTTNVVASNAPTSTITTDAIQGYEVGSLSWTPPADAAITNLDGVAKVGSDVFTIHTTSDTGMQLFSSMASAAANISINDNSLGFRNDELIMISDCSTTDLFQISNVDTGSSPVLISHDLSANSSAILSKPYGSTSTLSRYRAHTYYVADSGTTNTAGNPVFSLFRQDAYGTRTELVEGVNSMQLLYGERLGTNQLRYVAASAPGLDMSQVRSVRLGLLMQSNSEARSADDNVIYSLPGDTISPLGTVGATQTYAIDRTMKQVFVTTITLRNRL